MKVTEFVKNLPDCIYYFDGRELLRYDISGGDDPINEVSFYDSHNSVMDCWNTWEEFLESCTELYLSVADFKVSKQFNLEN